MQIGFASCAYLVLTTFLLILLKLRYKIVNQLSGWFLSFFIFFDFFSYFIAKSIPFFSPVVIPAILLLVGLTVGYINDKKCIKRLVTNNLFLISSIFIFYFMASFLLGSNYSYGIKKWSIFLFKGYFAGISVAVLSLSFRRINLKPIIYIGIICSVLLIIFGYENPTYPNRLIFGTANPIWESRSYFIMITLCLWYGKKDKLLRIFAACIGAYSAYLTGSRGPLAASVAVNVITFSEKLFSRDAISQLKKILWMGVIVLICFSALFYFNISFDDIVENQPRLKVLFDRELLERDPNVRGRLNAKNKAIEVWKDNLLFGTGLGGFAKMDERVYPHNLIVELLCEGGIFGFILWLSMIFLMWKKFGKTSILKVLFLQTIVYTLASGDFGSNFEYMLIGMPAIAYDGNDYEA